MDVRCKHCGEPVDLSELGNYAKAFARNGCTALRVMDNGGSVREAMETLPCGNEHFNNDLAEIDSAMYDLFGDDMDAIASFMEDYDV